MQFINPIHLITYVNNVDDIGDIISTPIERKVLADISSIKQSEFYQAQANGLKPEFTFIIRAFEYRGEESVKYGNKTYRILRTYDRLDGNIELTCIGAVNNASS
ncbi:phage head closure protein [Clostridium sp. UBA5712]|uniref:phage head closure protein n=1 Tax=Clostridium sp. UBA5712 TaxID=1946368 RepID=UPI0032164684